MKERRIFARKKSFLQGRVFYNQHRSSVDCLVRDISEHGAKLVFSDAVSIPDVVDLYLPAKDEVHRIRVQWRKGDEMGVDFGVAGEADETEATPPPSDLLGRLTKLEGDFTVLKRVVNELRAEMRALRSETV
jgi:PilZ domain